MRTFLNCLFVGLGLALFGLVLEKLKVAGFCYTSGYVHLNFLSTLFYAMGDPPTALTIVFICNFLIGAFIALVVELIRHSQRESSDG